jgi:hypothetical protein
MLRQKPKLPYNGLSVIMSNPARNDIKELLAGTSGWFLYQSCLLPNGVNQYEIDVRLADDDSPLLPNTKALLLLGQHAFSKYVGNGLTLNEGRGSPYYHNNIPCIATYTAQDAIDPKDYESTHNELLVNKKEELAENEEEDVFSTKSHGKTKRKNYRFWVKSDVKKVCQILHNDGKIPKLYDSEPNYFVLPDLDTLLYVLKNAKGEHLYFDLETDFVTYDIRCFSFCLSSRPFNVYCVPWLTPEYKPYYGQKGNAALWKALNVAIRNNVLVCHNGSEFDYLILFLKLHISINQVYDTLVAQHRYLPAVEKSLGHIVSLLTFEQFHKNEAAHGFHNQQQLEQLCLYCGKDVFTMYLCHQEQIKLMNKDSGLKASIELAQSAIKPYLTASILGMHYDEKMRVDWIAENDRLMMHYLKIMQKLCGPTVEPLISNKKCVEYFHNKMGYPVVARTETGNPSLAEDALYKLALKVGDNPLFKFLIKYRQTQKQTGTLNFKPWIK